MHLYLKAGRFAAALTAVLSATAISPAFEPVRIVPLGDSITQANDAHQSYRYPLWTKLIDHGVPVDIVGSMDANYWGNPQWPDYLGLSFDQDHEGHWGWEANEMLDGRPGEGSLPQWLMEYTADIVLFHVGTNDALHGHSTASTRDELESMLAILQADNADVTVLLARLIPSTDPAGSAIPPLNDEMDGIAARMTTVRSRIVVVDQDEGFVAATDLYDPWHPNPGGEEKMAEKWMQALAAGPLARPGLHWDAQGTTLLWDTPAAAEGSRVYAGSTWELGDRDENGFPLSGYGDCLASLPAASPGFTPGGEPEEGEILFYLLEIQSMGTSWGTGRTSSGRQRQPGLSCP